MKKGQKQKVRPISTSEGLLEAYDQGEFDSRKAKSRFVFFGELIGLGIIDWKWGKIKSSQQTWFESYDGIR